MKRQLLKLTKAMALACLLAVTATAQTFTQRVQEHSSGEGTVTIHHDAAIDRLVNAAPSSTTAAKPAPAPKATTKPTPTPKTATKETAKETSKASAKETSKTSAKETAKASAKETSKTSAKETAKSAKKESSNAPKKETSKASKKPQEDTTRQHSPQPDTTYQQPQTTEPTDTVPTTQQRHGYRTTGYRVQVFAGGSTRSDRQKAERTGNAMRQLLPGESVYVRFYSPRWVCRVGNYRTYEEAHEKMLAIRKMGYESATLVKGKIIVYE